MKAEGCDWIAGSQFLQEPPPEISEVDLETLLFVLPTEFRNLVLKVFAAMVDCDAFDGAVVQMPSSLLFLHTSLALNALRNALRSPLLHTSLIFDAFLKSLSNKTSIVWFIRAVEPQLSSLKSLDCAFVSACHTSSIASAL